MKLPQLVDYQRAVQGKMFADPVLRDGHPRLDPLRQPSVASGGFALTFDVNAGGHRFAVRCFHKKSERLHERYTAVAKFVHLHRSSLEFLTDVAYVTEGIRVNGNVFPIVRMPWVDGESLDSWVENHLHEQRRLDQVRRQITEVAVRLRAVDAAHGDLQHGNILVDSRDRIRLVDYDGMFLPELAGFGTSEYGHRNYQHPDRGSSYNKELDVFAASVIDLSLDALKHDPSLWKAFNTGENLILEAEDFAEPAKSEVFARLARITPLAERVRRLMDACQKSFAAVPAVLAGELTTTTDLGSSAGSRRQAGRSVVNAHDRETLISLVGDQVTIVGQVLDSRIFPGRNTTTTFINFGDWRRGDFRIVAWGKISKEIEAAYGKHAEALRGQWVTLTGMVKQFHSDRSDASSPQIELKRLQTLRVLSETEAKAQLAPPPRCETPSSPQPESAPPQQPKASESGVYRWKAPPKPKVKSTDELTRQLDQLYSSPSFAKPVPPTPPSRQPVTPRPAPQPYSPPPQQPAPPPHQPAPQQPAASHFFPPPPQPAPPLYFPPPQQPARPRARRAKAGWLQRLRDRLR